MRGLERNPSGQLAAVFERLRQDLLLAVRPYRPCIIAGLQYDLALARDADVVLTVSGACRPHWPLRLSFPCLTSPLIPAGARNRACVCLGRNTATVLKEVARQETVEGDGGPTTWVAAAGADSVGVRRAPSLRVAVAASSVGNNGSSSSGALLAPLPTGTAGSAVGAGGAAAPARGRPPLASRSERSMGTILSVVPAGAGGRTGAGTVMRTASAPLRVRSSGSDDVALFEMEGVAGPLPSQGARPGPPAPTATSATGSGSTPADLEVPCRPQARACTLPLCVCACILCMHVFALVCLSPLCVFACTSV
jgi:hypothetical protein